MQVKAQELRIVHAWCFFSWGFSSWTTLTHSTHAVFLATVLIHTLDQREGACKMKLEKWGRAQQGWILDTASGLATPPWEAI